MNPRDNASHGLFPTRDFDNTEFLANTRHPDCIEAPYGRRTPEFHSQYKLQVNNIQPAAELEADLPHSCSLDKPVLCVQLDARRLRCADAGNDRMHPARSGVINQ